MITIELEKMDVSEKVGVIGMIWDSLSSKSIPPKDWHKDELEKRIKEHRLNPNDGEPWDEAREELLSR